MNEPPNPPVAADECAGGRCYIANDAVMLCRWHEEQQREDATPPFTPVAKLADDAPDWYGGHEANAWAAGHEAGVADALSQVATLLRGPMVCPKQPACDHLTEWECAADVIDQPAPTAQTEAPDA